MNDALATGLGGLAVLVALIALRMPIAYAMILVGGVGVALLNGPDIFMSQLKTLAYGQFSIYDLSVVPMFVLMGAIATRAGLSRDLFRAAAAWLGWLPGGAAMSAIAACAGFGAVCGSSLATASTMGQVALPELRRLGYSDALATGTLAAGGVLGILIPPSVVLVIYAVIVEANIVTMFMAALIPGILAVLLFLATIALYVRLRPEAGPAAPRPTRAELTEASLRVLPVLGIFALVIGGIYLGFFNPTPAASIGAFLVWIYGAARGTVGLKALRGALLETARTTGMIYLILLGAEMLKIFMSRGGVPQAMAEWMANSGLAPMAVLLILLAALIALGCLMDSLSMILLVIPFFWPALVEINGGDYVPAAEAAFGMTTEDLKVWFGILALIVVELGLITPPVGMNVFVISALSGGVPMRRTFLGVAPFFFAELIRVGLLIALPALTLWLPRALS
ncbi:TRAP transporter large permease [Oceanicella actignis]|uniref:TRAP transporter large permease protein n=1 Tax=Oceanicella actignis TaxID=1189325 RepID=A0A1M7S9T9_9RHOB|nr:TRAP transporter large permease [Oceanicella actignis]SET30426.1 TRAP transporter, DctM subunit [Oceanicella actignis]SHN55233.1 TRAP transporter, DctM subunit [Oceanicella actignis]